MLLPPGAEIAVLTPINTLCNLIILDEQISNKYAFEIFIAAIYFADQSFFHIIYYSFQYIFFGPKSQICA
jgi:hypothetical protein